MAIVVMCFIALLVMPTTVEASDDKYRYGYKSSVELVSDADTITIEPNNLSCLVATVDADTNLIVSADVDNSIVGDLIFLEVTADDTDRTVTFGDNLTGTTATVDADGLKMFQLVYTGTAFVLIE